MPDIVYMLKNEAMPGLVLVGYISTRERLETHKKKLFTQEVPLPFSVYQAVEVDDGEEVVQKMRVTCGKFKPCKEREYYHLKPKVKQVFKQLTSRENRVPNQEGEAQGKRRKNWPGFKKLGIPMKAVLTYIHDRSITCTVCDNRHVRFREERMSVSKAGGKAGEETGYATSVSGTSCWEYEGKTLVDIWKTRKDQENDEDSSYPGADKAKRKRFTFDMIGLKPGAELHSTYDPRETCTVYDNKNVLFRGKVMSPSKAASIVAVEKGYSKTQGGPDRWKSGDRTLADIRKIVEPGGAGTLTFPDHSASRSK